VAAGRFDAYYEYNLQPWDLAPGMLLVREAGGLVTDDKGNAKVIESGNVVAGNLAIHKALMSALGHSKT
jgi:myo-inositol-1(or 4)-monophosphatase